MKMNLKKTFAFILVLALVLTMFSTNAFAASNEIRFKAGNFDDGELKVECGGKSITLKSGQNKTISLSNNMYNQTDTYTVTAIADSGKILKQWNIDGDIINGYGNTELNRSVDKHHTNKITPDFDDLVKLTVTNSPTNGGDVEVKIEGTKTTVTTEKTFKMAEGTRVRLEALSERDDDLYRFISYGGDVYEKDSVINITMDESKNVIANFRPKVRPVLEFVVDNGKGSYTAHFGYMLEGNEDVIISVSNANKVFGGGVSSQNQGQPITFSPGRHYDVFDVDFDGSTLSWKLDGKTITANNDRDNLRFTIRPEMFAYGDIIIENLSSGGDIVFDGQVFEGGAREIYVPCYTDGQPTALALTARPDDGLDFYSWIDNSSTKNPRYITFKSNWLGKSSMLIEPHPEFETGDVVLTVVANDNGQSSISKKVYNAGDLVDISDIASYIIAYTGYDFAGFVEASEDFVIYNDITLTAKFTAEGTVVITPVVTPTPTPVTIIVNTDVPKTGDTSADLSIAWILAMVLPLVGFAGYKLYKRNK